MQKTGLLAFDTASLYFRAFFGLPSSLRAVDGTPVNAVRGLLDFLARFIADYSPERIACCWDEAWRPAWRVALIPSYKAHRVAYGDVEIVPEELQVQIPLIRAVLAAAGLPVVGFPDAEADDVIGTLAGSNQRVRIVTGDRDLFQLADDERDCRVLYVGGGISRHEVVDDAWLQAKYGVSASDYVDFAVLRGDPSDGLPGVAGIGEKTAAKLVTEFGSLEQIVQAAQDRRLSPALSQRLAAAIDYLGPARAVVAVRRDLPLVLPDLRLPMQPADPDEFARLSEELKLGSSADRLVKALAAAGSS